MSAALHPTAIGGGRVDDSADGYTLHLPAASDGAYHDAQISDYAGRDAHSRAAPSRLRLRARAEAISGGTAGFGFWNHPFSPDQRGFRLPRAAWFFYSAAPNHIQLARDVPATGWKCATMDAANPLFLALIPFAPLGFLLMRVPPLYRLLWPIGQRALKVSERHIADHIPATWHDYALEWRADAVTFRIDGAIVHRAPLSPSGKMGFIAWVDNQYAIVTPQGRFGAGVSPVTTPATLALRDIRID